MRDGLEIFRSEFRLEEVARLIERTALWVSPGTFEILPLWFPEHARRAPFYKSNWSEPQYNTNRATGEKVHKREANIYAAKALDMALGIESNAKRNWSCCHIWSIDDPNFQRTNTVVADHRFYSCIANMVLLPTPLKAFTDSIPEIKAMLRICSSNLYGWRCDHPDVVDWDEPLDTDESFWKAYPASWPKTVGGDWPTGVRAVSNEIIKKATSRKLRIAHDMKVAGQHYPREQVRAALDYWGIDIEH